MTEREKNLYYIYKECFCNYDLITVFENNWGWVYDKLRGEQEEQIPDIVLQVVAQWIKETY